MLAIRSDNCARGYQSRVLYRFMWVKLMTNRIIVCGITSVLLLMEISKPVSSSLLSLSLFLSLSLSLPQRVWFTRSSCLARPVPPPFPPTGGWLPWDTPTERSSSSRTLTSHLWPRRGTEVKRFKLWGMKELTISAILHIMMHCRLLITWFVVPLA